MPGVVRDVTEIWKDNTKYQLNAQCATWDGKRVDVWECRRERMCPLHWSHIYPNLARLSRQLT
jgi:hypothetical protein